MDVRWYDTNRAPNEAAGSHSLMSMQANYVDEHLHFLHHEQ